MNGLDRAFARETVDRLRALDPERKPAWGRLTAPELVPHLLGAFHLSTGKLPPVKFTGNIFTTTLLRRIACTGWLLPPKGLNVQSEDGKILPALSSPGDVDTLAEVMESFIVKLESGTLGKLAIHPMFGDLGPEGWAKIHKVHVRHHLKQFGL